MNTTRNRPREEAFIVRIGDGNAGTAPDGWRATIVHVPTGDRCYVNAYADLCAFLESVRQARRQLPE